MVGEHFDTIVVGSGFGGSVSAYRLAAGGQRVCILERGKAHPPGSFARRPVDMAANFWDPSEGMHGLYNVWHFKGIEALVSSGLGGGSLIYANVLLRKPEHTFHGWPVSREALDPHYDAVEKMMNAQRFPLASPGFATPKTTAMEEAAAAIGVPWQLPPLAVTFANRGRPPAIGEPIPPPDYGNYHGLPRQTCRLCGECDVGCNYGSKNTLDHTYLSAAQHHGADIRTRSEVRSFEPRDGGGFTVDYVRHDEANAGRRTDTAKLPRTTLTCDRLVLGAGALGTTYLLLRNRSGLQHLGPALGTRFSGNGDLLSFAMGSKDRRLDASHGPVITSAMHVQRKGQEFWVQDAGYPGFVDWMVETAALPTKWRRGLRFAWHLVRSRLTRDPDADMGFEVAQLLGDTRLSSGSLPLLGMGHDVPDGVMKLRRGKLTNNWTTKTSRRYFDAVEAHMRDIAKELGADFRENPLSWFKRVITVHPLGGAPMGAHDKEGVVDQWGQAFNNPGLFVADGAAMPAPTGPNPSLTIAAFADRMAEHILEGAS
jgi:cholesterol oxidase